MKKTVSPGWGGAVRVSVKAVSLILTIDVSGSCKQASATVESEDAAVAHSVSDGAWIISVPSPARQASRGVQYGNGNIQVNDFSGSARGPGIQGANFSNLSFGSDGSFTIGNASGEDVPVMRLVLPSASAVEVSVDSGSVSICDSGHGILQYAGVRTKSAALSSSCDITVLRAETMSGNVFFSGDSGPCEIQTISGSISLTSARGAVRATTMSGAIDIYCAADIGVEAHSTAGSVSVAAHPGTHPLVDARSLTGRVRVQEST